MPIPLRADFEAQHLRALARRSQDAAQTRRLLALAAVYDGATRTEAARIGGVTLVPLPAKCPELNAQENAWQFLRDNWLSNRIFSSYEDLLDHCCDAWNKLVDQPWRIMSLGLRDWAHGF